MKSNPIVPELDIKQLTEIDKIDTSDTTTGKCENKNVKCSTWMIRHIELILPRSSKYEWVIWIHVSHLCSVKFIEKTDCILYTRQYTPNKHLVTAGSFMLYA